MKAKISTNFAGIGTITTKGPSMKTMAGLVHQHLPLLPLILNSIPLAPAFKLDHKRSSRLRCKSHNFDIKGAGIDDNA